MSAPPGILFVIDELLQLGGAERSLLRIVEKLPRDRFTPYALTFRHNPNVREFDRFPCPLEIYPVHNLYSWNTVKYVPRLLDRIRSANIRIVHAFFETADLWAGMTAKTFGRCIWVSSRRDLGIQRNWRLNLLYRLANPFIDQVQAVSDNVRDYLVEADRLDPARVVTVPNAIDLDSMPPALPRGEARRRWGLPEDRPLVITLANIRHVKGIDVLVEAAAITVHERPDAVFAVAGEILEPDYFASIQDRIRALGLGDSVRFLGQVPVPIQLLCDADVFLLPSRSEGMSNALLEAMASRLPAIVTKTGGNPELVLEGRTGFLVSVEDPAETAERLLSLLGNPEAARNMGDAARSRLEEHYTLPAAMTLLLGQYETLLGDSD